MKKTALLIMFLVANSMLSQGIIFEHGTFAEVLTKAKAEKKMVFVDCYTTWCGPCKMMTKEVFPQDETGQYMNPNFVSIKIDMEKGEGIDLAKKYEVKAFPTLLFMDANGKVVHSVVGGLHTKEFIEAAKIAFDPTKQVSYIESQYNAGNRDITLVAQYVKALFNAFKQEEVEKVGKAFIPTMTESQYMTEDGFTILAYTGVDYKSKPYNYVLKNKTAFIAKEGIGQDSYNYFIGSTINKYLTQTANTKNLEELNKAIKDTETDYEFPQKAQMISYYQGQYYLTHKEYESWFDINKKEADSEFAKNQKTGLASYVNTAYRIAVDPTLESAGLYQKAIEMIEKVKNADPEFIAVHYCLAALYKKTGNKAMALENINIYAKKNADRGVEPDSQLTKLKSEIESL